MQELVSDNYREIANHIDCGSDWKSWLLVCKDFAAMANRAQVARFSNHLTTLLKLYPDRYWD
jgi:hypothetical protein